LANDRGLLTCLTEVQANGVAGDGPVPTVETVRWAFSAEGADALADGEEHVLRRVRRIGRLQAGWPTPVDHQRRAQRAVSIPGFWLMGLHLANQARRGRTDGGLPYVWPLQFSFSSR